MTAPTPRDKNAPLVEVRNLVTRFDLRGGVLGRISGRVHAVENVSFDIFPGETLALVGHGISLSLVRAGLLGLAQVDHEVWQRLSFGTYAVASLAPPAIIQDFAQSKNTVR